MGKRRRKAALGATFALLVAACANSTANDETIRAERQRPASQTSTTAAAVAAGQPAALAFAGFLTPAVPDSACVAGDRPALSLHGHSTGEALWSVPIPRPNGPSVVHEDLAVLAFGWDRGQRPSVGAIDLLTQTPLWQRFVDEEVEQLALVDNTVVAITSTAVRGIDLASGEDSWIATTEFGFDQIEIAGDTAFAIDPTGVFAIDLATGTYAWRQRIERPDQLAATAELVVVAADRRIIAIDPAERAMLWERETTRVAVGELWLRDSVALVELAPSIAPGGGIEALDAGTGIVSWTLHNIGTVEWHNADTFLTSTAAESFREGEAYDVRLVEAATGATRWTIPSTAPLASSIVALSHNRAILIDPSPTSGDTTRIRSIDSRSGETLWTTTSATRPVGAALHANTAYIHTVVPTYASERGQVVALRDGVAASTITTVDGVRIAPVVRADGLLVTSGERSATCAGRELVSP